MPIPVRVPPASISMEEVTVVQWLVDDGEHVDTGQPVVEIETDKSTIEVVAPESGVLRHLAPTGGVVAADGVLAEVGEPAPQDAPAPQVDREARPPDAHRRVAVPPAASRAGAGVRATPAARSFAARTGVDLNAIEGTGPAGQVTAKDVVRAGAAVADGDEDARAASVRAITASWQAVPHIHIGGELRADGIVACRRNGAGARQPTVTDLLVFALARALKDVPELNAVMQRDGSIIPAQSVDCVVATATPKGLVTPVIRRADELSISEISATRARIVAAAREGRLEPDARGPGSITLSNLGMYPVDFFAPVINAPQVALVATGRVREAFGGAGDESRYRMWTNVAIDHRAADGEAGGRFLAAFERELAGLPAAAR